MREMIKDFFNNIFLKTYLIFHFLTRLALASYAIYYKQIPILDLPVIFAVGFLNDLVSLAYILPIILFLAALFNKKARSSRFFAIIVFALYFVVIFALGFNLIAELVFWDEYGTKFNFIAVDYLVYTHEIIGTLLESMPVYELLAGLTIFALLISGLMLEKLKNSSLQINKIHNGIFAVLVAVIATFLFKLYTPLSLNLLQNRYANELGRNGVYELFSAFRNNSLDYFKFYPNKPKDEALQQVRQLIEQANREFVNQNSLEYKVNSFEKNEKKNVVFIVVESLSANFMGQFGNPDGITPNLDKIADQSLFFTNVYATGTRTVRGLEALTLSIAPTPGTSVIRRHHNNNLHNIASIFRDNGYSNLFAYGGYSYFDNLDQYFSHNAFQVLDRSDLAKNEITFANVWGVADEDLFNKVIGALDSYHEESKPFFSMIMTVSNHRPYTFPEGRIDMPSGGGRAAGVKYTDYAIGKFLEDASKKLWFDNTIFVIVADHCAGSSGKKDLPVHKYHIPFMIYAPKIVNPKKVNYLASQIDIVPTILGLMNFEYKAQFLGKDLLIENPNRAFISTYQLLGYLKNDSLVILKPRQEPETYNIKGHKQQKITNNQELIDEAVALYQTSYSLFKDGSLKEQVEE